MTPTRLAEELKSLQRKNIYNSVPDTQGKAWYLWRFLRCGVDRAGRKYKTVR